MIDVQKFMSPTPQTVSRDTALSQAKHLMSELEIRHLPVIEGDKIIGIISDRDVRLVGAIKGVNLEKILVDDVMVTDLYVVTADAPLEQVVMVMADRKLGSALVMEKGKIVGIFTVIDALRGLSELLQARST